MTTLSADRGTLTLGPWALPLTPEQIDAAARVRCDAAAQDLGTCETRRDGEYTLTVFLAPAPRGAARPIRPLGVPHE